MLEAKQIHFLGIGGIGVSALAQVALAQGTKVTGSDSTVDPTENPAIARLLEHGATIYTGHDAANIAPETTLVVATAAIRDSNPELMEARRRGLPILSRAEMLGQLMDMQQGPRIAVAGTHGKTTTTAMIGVILQEVGLDPTVFVGGEVGQLGGNVRPGSLKGPFVAEACEAYDSFLELRPDVVVLTNVEADHLDHYGTYENVLEGFRNFLRKTRPGGTILYCGDDPGACAVVDKLEGLAAGVHMLDYGTGNRRYSGAKAKNIRHGRYPEFEWHCETPFTQVHLQVPGDHNVLDALAALTCAHIIGVSAAAASSGVERFHKVTRRQDILGEFVLNIAKPGEAERPIPLVLMDDYAHHPTEIRATLSALRAGWPTHLIGVVFQPHLYSRTRDFMAEFAEELSRADALIVTDIYPAREVPMPGITSDKIIEKVQEKQSDAVSLYVPERRDCAEILLNMLRKLAGEDSEKHGAIALFMGAGSIREQAEQAAEDGCKKAMKREML